MFNSRMYKRYYPVKSPEDIFNMDIEDKKKIAKWVKTIIADVYIHNIRNIKRASSAGLKECWVIDFQSDKDKEYVNDVYCKITTEPFSMTAEDIKLVNFVLYRHKYVSIISAYCFPISTTE